MLKLAASFLAGLLLVTTAHGQRNPFLVTALNCYLFFGGGETSRDFDQPHTSSDYWKKAGNLISLLPTNAPLFVGFQEIGRGRETTHLAQVACLHYKHRYLPIFVQGKDTYTGEDVGAMLCLDFGWGLAAKPARDPDLDNWLSKHLVVSLTNAVTSLEICVVHLRRAVGSGGAEKQKEQCHALWLWARKHLQQDTNANLIILGDFNETKLVGDPKQSLAVMLSPNEPFHDAFEFAKSRVHTHANGNAYDRILISEAIVNGAAGLRFEGVSVREHSHGKGKDRQLFTDHFPVTAALSLQARPKTRISDQPIKR